MSNNFLGRFDNPRLIVDPVRVEPDLSGMRAFVVAAEELHFGRAAARLFLTQQAFSKRIRRLEDALGVALFERTTRRVELTDAGHRFLGPAKDALAAYDTAVAAVREPLGPLRVDVNAERFSPLRILRAAVRAEPGLSVEPSMRQGFPMALAGVEGRELDAAFGRVHDIGRRWPAELAHRPVHAEQLHAFVLGGHRFAERDALRLADLRDGGIAMPDPAGAHEWRGYLTRLCAEFGVPLRWTDPAIGVRHYEDQMRAETHAVAIGEAGMDLPHDLRMRRIPLVDPTPLLLWSVAWRRHDRDPRLARLLRALPHPAVPSGGWLPDIDRALLG